MILHNTVTESITDPATSRCFKKTLHFCFVLLAQCMEHVDLGCGVRYTESGPWLFNFLLNGLGKNASGQNCFFNVFQWIFGDLW